MNNIITNHNKTILNRNETVNKKNGNCISKNTCPLKEECQAENIIFYPVWNKLNYDKKYYMGSCETTFEKRVANHNWSFDNEQNKIEAGLSKEVWNLKSANKKAEIVWKTIRGCAPVDLAILRCKLCLNGKSEIATHQGTNLLSKTLELISKYRNLNNLLLMNFEGSITWWQITNSFDKNLIPVHCFYSLAIPL